MTNELLNNAFGKLDRRIFLKRRRLIENPACQNDERAMVITIFIFPNEELRCKMTFDDAICRSVESFSDGSVRDSARATSAFLIEEDRSARACNAPSDAWAVPARRQQA